MDLPGQVRHQAVQEALTALPAAGSWLRGENGACGFLSGSGGFCVAWGGRILRFVGPRRLAETESFLSSRIGGELAALGKLIPTRRLDEQALEDLRGDVAFSHLLNGCEAAAVFEHERVRFPSYPYEWPAQMLSAAGMLTLDLAQAGLEEGWGLTDATPYNVLFRGSKPVFVDLLSFVRRDPHDPVWKAHAQFCRTFLLPLLAHKYWGVRPADVFTKRRDGLESGEVYRLCGPLRRFRPLFLSQVTLPTWLSRAKPDNSIYHSHTVRDAHKARFILESLFKRLRRALRAVKPDRGKDSPWSGYMESHAYPGDSFLAKEGFVQQALRECRPRHVLDVGANTGHFSRLAAQAGAGVVAIDSDFGSAGALWQEAAARNQDILPLVVDLSRPSAAKGWRNRESLSFIERATGAFDLVVMLAVLHHLLVTDRIPSGEILDLLADLTTRYLLIEFVDPQDPMFQNLARGRDHLHGDLSPAYFEQVCQRRFRIVRQARLPGLERTLYLLAKKAD